MQLVLKFEIFKMKYIRGFGSIIELGYMKYEEIIFV